MGEFEPVTSSEGSARDAQRFRVVAIIAAIVSLPFALAHLGVGLFVLPTFRSMYSDMGGELPTVVQALLNIQPIFGPLLFAIDVGIFAGFYLLAKRWWIGLLFVPPLAYLATGVLLIPLLYMPLFNVITLVQ